MSKMFSPKRLLTAVIIALVMGGGAAIVQDLNDTPVSPPIARQQLPPVQEGPLKETDLAHATSVFGPFEPIVVSPDTPNPETKSPAVLILNQDGSTAASRNWTIPFDPHSWARRDASQIRSISMEVGYATFGSSLQRTFVVKANQPFIFEQTPQDVCLIDAQGNTWATTTARAEASRQKL